MLVDWSLQRRKTFLSPCKKHNHHIKIVQVKVWQPVGLAVKLTQVFIVKNVQFLHWWLTHAQGTCDGGLKDIMKFCVCSSQLWGLHTSTYKEAEYLPCFKVSSLFEAFRPEIKFTQTAVLDFLYDLLYKYQSILSVSTIKHLLLNQTSALAHHQRSSVILS